MHVAREQLQTVFASVVHRRLHHIKAAVPVEWVSLSKYAREKRRTVRGIQYRLDDVKLPSRVYRIPRPVKHYRRADLDRLLRKVS